MWQQVYDPLGMQALSALVAAIPIIIFLLGLTVFKMTGLRAAIIALVASIVIAVPIFHLPLSATAGSILYGFLLGLWPVGWIVIMAVWLYRIAVRAGYFDVIESSISALSEDQRLQVLLIAFCFGGFLEGAAGFGIPIAICGALLYHLGFEPLRGAVLSLVANIAVGAYGAIGIPVIVGAKVGDVPLGDLSHMMIPVIQIITICIPLVLVAMVDGMRGLKEIGWVALVLGIVVSASQALLLYVAGPELVDIVPPLLGMVVLAGILRVWKPKTIFRESTAPSLEELRETAETPEIKRVIRAWSPFYILSACILFWSIPAIAALFKKANITFSIPGVHEKIMIHAPIVADPTPLQAEWTWNIIGAAGTAILVAVLITNVVTPDITWGQSMEEFQGTMKQLWKPVLLICLVMAVANVMSSAGMSSSMALALAATGFIFPLVSPIIGWVGVFVTGSVTNSNTLFASLQAVTGQQIGVSKTLMVASNTSGGVMAKALSPQSIAIATAAVERQGEESKVTRDVLVYSLALLAVLGVWVFILSLL